MEDGHYVASRSSPAASGRPPSTRSTRKGRFPSLLQRPACIGVALFTGAGKGGSRAGGAGPASAPLCAAPGDPQSIIRRQGFNVPEPGVPKSAPMKKLGDPIRVPVPRGGRANYLTTLGIGKFGNLDQQHIFTALCRLRPSLKLLPTPFPSTDL